MLGDTLHAWLAYIAPLYPFGIPRSSIKAITPAVPSVKVAFLLDREYHSDDPESVLLDAAIAKGLRMELKETARGSVETNLPAAQVTVRCARRAKNPWSYGSDGRTLVDTHSLSDICRDSVAKREFWEDLKVLLEYLGRQS